jgi:hypothetical protein
MAARGVHRADHSQPAARRFHRGTKRGRARPDRAYALARRCFTRDQPRPSSFPLHPSGSRTRRCPSRLLSLARMDVCVHEEGTRADTGPRNLAGRPRSCAPNRQRRVKADHRRHACFCRRLSVELRRPRRLSARSQTATSEGPPRRLEPPAPRRRRPRARVDALATALAGRADLTRVPLAPLGEPLQHVEVPSFDGSGCRAEITGFLRFVPVLGPDVGLVGPVSRACGPVACPSWSDRSAAWKPSPWWAACRVRHRRGGGRTRARSARGRDA